MVLIRNLFQRYEHVLIIFFLFFYVVFNMHGKDEGIVNGSTVTSVDSNTVKVAEVVRKVRAQAKKDSPFGMHTSFYPPYRDMKKLELSRKMKSFDGKSSETVAYSTATDLGILWERPTNPVISWSFVQKDKDNLKDGVYDWMTSDNFLMRIPHGLNIVVTFDVSKDQYMIPGTWQFSSDIQDVADMYVKFVQKTVERYDGDGVDDMPGLKNPVKYWQVENEPTFNPRASVAKKGSATKSAKKKASSGSVKSAAVMPSEGDESLTDVVDGPPPPPFRELPPEGVDFGPPPLPDGVEFDRPPFGVPPGRPFDAPGPFGRAVRQEGSSTVESDNYDWQNYSDFQKISYEAIKSADSEAIVLGAGVFGALPDSIDREFDSIDKFWQPLLQELAGKYIDVFDFHWFGVWKDSAVLYKKIRTALDDNGFSVVDIWMTEVGESSLEGEDKQAIDLVRRMVYPLTYGVKKVFWAWGLIEGFPPFNCKSFFDDTALIYDGYCDGDPGYGVKKLAYYTYKELIYKLDGIDLKKIEPLSEGTNNVYAYRFKKENGFVDVVWLDYENCTEKDKDGVQFEHRLPVDGKFSIQEGVPKYKNGESIKSSDNNIFNTKTVKSTNKTIPLTVTKIPLYVEYLP
ncbi:MAG: hypothetical protein L3V56_11125 [Candidatus Magnetoovum sp. WYHC-5]|nr:hypothetical protein [Candidatus Magnetoovum sp. WYHC-5]